MSGLPRSVLRQVERLRAERLAAERKEAERIARAEQSARFKAEKGEG